MHNLTKKNKQRIRNDIITGARLYERYLVSKAFLIITDNGTVNTVCFNKKDFAHLAGVRTTLSDRDLYENAAKGTLTVGNILSNQYYDFGTIRKKIIRLKKINKIIYANANTNLMLVNLHTHTTNFPLAIESIVTSMVVAFTGNDYYARSLRNNNQTESETKENILAIFSKEKIL